MPHVFFFFFVNFAQFWLRGLPLWVSLGTDFYSAHAVSLCSLSFEQYYFTMLRSILWLAVGALSQQAGTLQSETHPPLTTYACTGPGQCTSESSYITLDANWRWTHKAGTSTNCYTGDEWDGGICPDPVTCAQNCALEGADYRGTYGVDVQGDSVGITLVTKGQYDTNIGARTYVMDSSSTYKLYKLKNREFAFDVDVSTLDCGINGALYFVDMDPDGGLSKYPNNKAGAAYGTGYCDAQCPHDDKFINGEANIVGWAPDPGGDPNSGDGKFGTCCTEMDVWEANSISSAVTPHMCTVNGQYRCNGTECGDDSAGQRFLGVCDKNGCDLNPFRGGNTAFYGPGSGPPPPPPPPPSGCTLSLNTSASNVCVCAQHSFSTALPPPFTPTQHTQTPLSCIYPPPPPHTHAERQHGRYFGHALHTGGPRWLLRRVQLHGGVRGLYLRGVLLRVLPEVQPGDAHCGPGRNLGH